MRDPDPTQEFSVWRRNHGPGTLVLGGNRATGAGATGSNYVVLAEPFTPDPQGVLVLQGTAGGGSVGLTIAGVFVSVNTTAGQTGAQVVFALVVAINADPTLIGLGVSALAEGGTLLVDEAISSVAIDDAGLAPPVPALARWQLALLAGAVALALVGAARAQGLG